MARFVCVWASSLGMAAAAWSQEEPLHPPHLSVEGDAEYLRSSGWLFITRGSEPGSATRIHERREITLDSEVLAAVQTVTRISGEHAVGFRLASIDETGTRSTPDDFVYHGTLFPAGRAVFSNVGFLLAGVDYQYQWSPIEGLELTPHLGFEYWGFSSHLKTVDPGTPLDEKRSFSSGYWLSGVEASVRLEEGLRARLSVLGGVDGADRNFLEIRGGFRVRLLPAFSLAAGYLLQGIQFHTSTNRADLRFVGPSAGLEMSF